MLTWKISINLVNLKGNHHEKSCLLKPHYLTTKIQKTIHIQLLCNYPLGITITMQLSL
jgi:hypothetical protein